MAQSTILHFAKLFLESRGKQQTVMDEDVNLVFRDPGIRSGYRKPYRAWSYYLSSLFHVHNETVNIWTHLIGCIMLCYELYTHARMYEFWTDGATRPIFVYLMTSIAVTLFSTAAHMLHNKSDNAHYTCFQVDYAGIGLFFYGIGLVSFYYCCFDERLYTTFLPYFLPFNTLMAWLTCLFCSISKLNFEVSHPLTRKLLLIGSTGLHFTSYYSIGGLPRYITCLMDSDCSFSSLWLHNLNFAVLFTSVLFYAAHIPEMISPGRFDIIGHGHQIFHVLNVVNSYVTLAIARDDLKHHQQLSWQRDFPSAWALIVSFGLIILADILTIVILSKYVNGRVERDRSM